MGTTTGLTEREAAVVGAVRTDLFIGGEYRPGAAGRIPVEDPATQEPFVIIQPPPNVTGALHLGHASRTATEDLMIRRGHKAAAGLQIETSRIKEFRQAVNDHADKTLGPDDLRPSLGLCA